MDINTGIAVVNPNGVAANVTYTLRDTNANVQGTIGHQTVASGAHFARFITDLNSVAPDFSLPNGFNTSIKYGSLDISSDQALSIVALRLTTNQRGEQLMTSTPIADMSKPLDSLSRYLSQFADGGGYEMGIYITTIILLNTSNAIETGTISIQADDGSGLEVTPALPVGETRKSTFNYSIQPGGVYILRTDGSPASWLVGSVKLISTSGSSPVAAGVFSFTQRGVLVTESGVPAVVPTTHARIYIDQSGGHQTGLAMANPGGAQINIALKAYQLDGATPAGNNNNVQLSANGHTARFVSELSGLAAGFTGVLDLSSTSQFVAVTLRALTNSRGDFLLTTFPIADALQSAPFPIIFPQIADGGGYVSQFIVLSAGGASITIIYLYNDRGNPMVLVM